MISASKHRIYIQHVSESLLQVVLTDLIAKTSSGSGRLRHIYWKITADYDDSCLFSMQLVVAEIQYQKPALLPMHHKSANLRRPWACPPQNAIIIMLYPGKSNYLLASFPSNRRPTESPLA